MTQCRGFSLLERTSRWLVSDAIKRDFPGLTLILETYS
jgi:hypothetical protein